MSWIGGAQGTVVEFSVTLWLLSRTPRRWFHAGGNIRRLLLHIDHGVFVFSSSDLRVDFATGLLYEYLGYGMQANTKGGERACRSGEREMSSVGGDPLFMSWS